MNNTPTPETDAARHDLSDYGSPVPCSWGDWIHADVASKLERERDEARELCRELADLVAYGLGQSGEPWSLDAMRQATDAIQKAKQMGTLPTD